MAIGPEQMNVPGPKLILSPQQAKSVAEQAKRCSHVEVEDSRAGYLKVRSFDREGDPSASARQGQAQGDRRSAGKLCEGALAALSNSQHENY